MKISILKRTFVAACVVLGLWLLGPADAWSQTTVTLNPIADTDTQSDNATGTNTVLNASLHNFIFLKFNLSSVAGTVSSAKVRIYRPASGAATLNVSNGSPDSWTEGGTDPTLGTLIGSTAMGTGAGYFEVDVTSRVATESTGDDLITFGITTNLGTWQGFNSRENASNKPQLVVIYSGGSDTQAPTVPGGLSSSSIAQTSFTLSWSASTDNVAVTGYEIFRNGSSIGTTASTSFNVTGLTAATTYAMTVRARDAVPNWSAQSTALNVTTSSGSSGSTKYEAENATLTGTTAASAGTGFSGTGYVTSLDNSGDKITFTVNASSAGSYPLVIRYQNSCGACEKFQDVKINSAAAVNTQFLATATGWSDKNYGNISLNAGNNTIEIIRSWGWTDIDYITVGVTGGGDTQAPTVPSGLASSSITQTSFTLSWTASTDNTAVTGYEIFRNGSSIGTSSTTSFNVTGLAAATTYAMTVRARDAVPNWSAQSTALNVTTQSTGSSLTVSPGSLSIGSAAGSSPIAVTSNVSWTATDNQSWITVSPASGSNNGTVNVTVTANTGSTSRAGTVTIAGGSITRTIAVTQSGVTSGQATIGTNFWRVDWGSGWSDYYNSGVNWSTTTNPWRSDFVSDMAPYSVLRFMDWGPTNGSEFVNWSSRIQKTANHYTTTVPLTNGDGSSTTGQGVAYEWQIDLCNRATSDMWINVPHKASDDFVRQLARLIRDNLNSSRKVYVEYSNEVWNWGFDQTNYADAQGISRGFVGSYPFKGNSVYINAWWGFYVYRSCQVAKIFEEEFAGQTNRLVKVLGGQLGYDNWPDLVAQWGDVHPVALQHLAALTQPSINPNNVTFDAYALAPYWNGDNLTTMQASIDYLVEKMDETQRALTNHGPGNIKLICYEAGQDGGNQVANAQNAGIYNVYIDALNRIGAKIQGPLVHYTHVGWDGGHAWGAKQNTSSTLSASHKYRAIVDWVNSHGGTPPPPFITAATEEVNGVRIYPNPTRENILNVDIYSDRTTEATITMVTPTSQQVAGLKKTLVEGNNSIQIPIAHVKNGIHVVVIQRGFERTVQKVIIDR
jgi:chitodextrinase